MSGSPASFSGPRVSLNPFLSPELLQYQATRPVNEIAVSEPAVVARAKAAQSSVHEPVLSAQVLSATTPVVPETAASKPAVVAPAKATHDSATVEEGAKTQCDENSSRHFNNKTFSDLKIKFQDREFHAHRFVLCQKSKYFEKLCHPDSPFAEASAKELTLHDDDPDAVWAMLRHLYNFLLKPPRLDLGVEDKLRFYCNVIAVSDKFGISALDDEASRSVNTFLISLDDPGLLLACLRIITGNYSDYSSLDQCAVSIARPRLSKLALLAEFPAWLATQPLVLQAIVEDAAKGRARMTFPLGQYKKVAKFKCVAEGFPKVLVPPKPKCHGQPGVPDGFFYEHTSE